MSVLISCEVGGDAVPPQFIAKKNRNTAQRAPNKTLRKKPARTKQTEKSLRSGQLPSTLSVDEPARYVVDRMAVRLGAPVIVNEYSLDLIDVTRSLRHRQLFPTTTRGWSSEDRRQLIDQIYNPYRNRVRRTVTKMLTRSSCLIHLSVRTFASYHRDDPRRADMGLLYDPARDDEIDLCLDWIDEMWDEVPMLRVRRNYPRRGTCDSINKAMRTEYAHRNYIGIEMMLNRAWVGRPIAIRDQVIDGICWTLQEVLGTSQSKAA